MAKKPPIRTLKQLRSLIVDLGLAEDRVSRRLATELHDHLVQSLVLCRMKMGLLGVHVEKEPALSLYNEAKRYLDDGIACTRGMLADLHPVYLSGPDGLRSAVGWLAEKLQRHGLKVIVEDDGRPCVLDETRIILLYRSIHHLLFSIAGGTGSRELILRMRRDRQNLEMTLAGYPGKTSRGPDGKRAAPSLSLIEEYLAHFGGRLKVLTAPGQSATLRLVIPLSAKRAK
jgi:signal transduction histidine kinase